MGNYVTLKPPGVGKNVNAHTASSSARFRSALRSASS